MKKEDQAVLGVRLEGRAVRENRIALADLGDLA